MFLEDSTGTSYSKEGRLIGYDPTYDLAVLKVCNCIAFGWSSAVALI